ncbi:helix-turn-helix domain-containing protein [Streptomyces pseudogriseolus]|uniref:helix-turn-helix domain-containing protein n=1 Tax=Streptomyces pseudogriseolus TaxID=36817 RepID=UPI003FA3399A
MADDKKNPLGPSGEQVRVNLKRVREARGMTKKQLADRVQELDRPIPPLGISRIEAGTRRVDADDLVALSVALRVSPMTLLLPWSDRADAPAEVTAAGVVPAAAAWLWADGVRPLDPSPTDPRGDAHRFLLDSRPAWARDAVRLAWSQGEVGQGEWDQQTGLHEWYEKIETSGAETEDDG